MPRRKNPLLELKKVDHGGALRNLRTPEQQPEGSVLSEAQPQNAPADGKLGLFAAGETSTDRPSTRRIGTVADLELNLTALLKSILLEDAVDAYQESDRTMTNLEVIARGMVADAMRGGGAARELVIDRVEGKAVRAAQVTPPDTSLEEQIDRSSVEALNALIPKE